MYTNVRTPGTLLHALSRRYHKYDATIDIVSYLYALCSLTSVGTSAQSAYDSCTALHDFGEGRPLKRSSSEKESDVMISANESESVIRSPHETEEPEIAMESMGGGGSSSLPPGAPRGPPAALALLP